MRVGRSGYQVQQRGPGRTIAFAVALQITLAASSTWADLMPGNCPPQNLVVTLNTGWDENAEALIVSGEPDDDWNVLAAPPGAMPSPPDAGVRDASSAWLTLPDSKWIASSAPTGPFGTYVYETCWCMDDSFTSPLLTFAIRADDQADVYLNGFPLISLPEGTFNDALALGMSVSDPSEFFVGLNCMTVIVQQLYGGPHGFNLTGTVTAEDGRCCGCYELPPDAEGWWRLDETTGTIAADTVNAHDGTRTHLILTEALPTPALGFVAGSLSFDGFDGYVAVPDHPGLDFDSSADLTIDAWIHTDSPVREAIVNKKSAAFNTPGYTFFVGSGVLGFEMADGATTVVCNAGSGLNDSTWHFVAVTVDRDDPAGLKLYIDGLPLPGTCNPMPIGSMANAEAFLIGARPSLLPGALWWRGRLDEIEIFRRALSATEIHELYVAGGAGKCPPEVPTACEQSGSPVCNGSCPPGELCVQGPGLACVCEPPPPCGAPGDYPTCNGSCPQGLECNPIPGASDCACMEEFPACGSTSYPECNGSCPQGETCENVFGTDDCVCKPQQAACGDGLFPECNGACPVDQKCVARQAPIPGCECMPCADLGPSGLGGIIVGWPASKDQLRWTGAPECALVYNTYRFTGASLPDVNADGLAEDYGSCHIGDVIGNDAADRSTPPAGQLHWYLVTGEDFFVEGSLGENSEQVERPNLSPCP